MTATATEAPSDTWPEGALYYSPRGLYPFQAEDIARAYLGMQSGIPEWMFVWDTGLGKSHAAMRLATLGFEDDAVDFVLLVCERGKLKEWQSDFEEFTKLDVRLHHGPRRKRLFHEPFLPQVLITTYETGKADLVQTEQTGRSRRKTLTSGDLLTKILKHSRRPLIIFDEADRLSNRSAMNYRCYEHVLKTFRKQFKIPVVMLTGTPIRTDWENVFNQLRLLRPASMPLVKEFGNYFVRARDMYGRALYRDHRMGEFADLCTGMVLAKSKTDRDVIDQFPATTEEAMWVDLEGEQAKLYELVKGLDGVAGQRTALRQICAHPASLLHSATEGVSKLTKLLVAEYGEDELRAMPSAKTEALCDYLERVVKHQGAKAVVFTFFGPSVIPHLRAALTARGIPVRTHDEDDGIKRFRADPDGCVLLASDAVARGINLPEASYLIEYDMATSYGLRTQRINRASRIGSGGPSLTVRSMLCRDSIEVPLMYGMLRGNHQTDTLLGRGVTGEEFLTASMRQDLLMKGMT
jgi:SNF2 family DNA or RNA helicase